MVSTSTITMCFDDVGVSYRNSMRFMGSRKNWALRHISFDVRRGETLGIIGRNGAGKSTLMKLLADIINPDEGKIEREFGKLKRLSWKVGFLMLLRGRENPLLTGSLLGWGKKDIRRGRNQRIEFSRLDSKITNPL